MGPALLIAICRENGDAMRELTGISRPAYSVYGVCGSRNFRQFVHRVAVFTADSDPQCWSHFNTGVYGRYITKQKRAPLNCAKFLPSGAVTNAFPTEFR